MYTYAASLVRVIDGDTVVLDVDLGFSITVRQHFRLLGIDTPERGQPGSEAATIFVRDWFASHPAPVTLESYKPDKYGRYLAVISDSSPEPSLNAALLAAGLARLYPS